MKLTEPLTKYPIEIDINDDPENRIISMYADNKVVVIEMLLFRKGVNTMKVTLDGEKV